MEAPKFKSSLALLNLRQKDFAEMTGLNRNTISRYATGRLEIPKIVERYLNAVMDGNEPISLANPSYVRLSVSIDPDVYDRLVGAARADKRTISSMVNKIFDDWLRQRAFVRGEPS